MQNILVAYDGTDPAKRALDTAADLSEKFGASIGVISVIPVHGGRVPVDPWDDNEVHARELIEARDILRLRGAEPKLYEPAGDPAASIERIAEAGGYDTVVVGSRKLGALARTLQGSVSEHVATHVRSTVVIAQ